MNELRNVWAKSPPRGQRTGEALTAHSLATLRGAQALRARVGTVACLPARFWAWVSLAALLHDAGKIPDGFQAMLGNSTIPAKRWGERHEVYSLGFVAELLADLPADERLWVASGVVTHHRALTQPHGHQGRDALLVRYDEDDAADLGVRFAPVDEKRAAALLDWFAATAHAHGLLPASIPVRGRPRVELTHADLAGGVWRLLEELRQRWQWKLPRDQEPLGHIAVLLQGAVTLADHLSSAHRELLTQQPLDREYRVRFERRLTERGHALWPHQERCAEVGTHLLVRAPTGSGKTEAALLWAAGRLREIADTTGGVPRLFYLLPYLASINAMTDRLTRELGSADIGVAHSRSASYYLTRALADECAETDGEADAESSPAGGTETEIPSMARARAADKAVARAGATRAFRELVRVGTPYQLLRGALAGPAHSGILIDAANSVFIVDELHAFEPTRLGMILAMLEFCVRLGGRVAVLSATIPDALRALLHETLGGELTLIEPAERPPVRHRIGIRAAHLTESDSIAEISTALRAGDAVLVVANNVADAQELFAVLGPVAREVHGERDEGDAALLLHSRFRRMDRARIESALRERYGVGRTARQGGLLVATQTIEVSLDVDFDLLHTSGAPLDALLQRFGRVNRLGVREAAPVIVHEPRYGARRSGGAQQYADGVYEAEPTALGWDILSAHRDAVVDDRAVTGWLNEIHASSWGAQWAGEVRRVRADFTKNYLTFAQPFQDRGDLATAFDELFEGQEAVLADDIPAYTRALNAATGRAGRLLADEYLIPLPYYRLSRARWAPGLQVRRIDADYDPTTGLGAPRGLDTARYVPGEIL